MAIGDKWLEEFKTNIKSRGIDMGSGKVPIVAVTLKRIDDLNFHCTAIMDIGNDKIEAVYCLVDIEPDDTPIDAANYFLNDYPSEEAVDE